MQEYRLGEGAFICHDVAVGPVDRSLFQRLPLASFVEVPSFDFRDDRGA